VNKKLVFTAYNRPEYLKEAVHSWNQVENILDWEINYFLEPSELQKEMIYQFSRLECGELWGTVHDQKLGVLTNPWFAMQHSFSMGADFTVIAEDDIVVSRDVLNYFNWAMKHYKDDKNVLAVLAFSKVEAGANMSEEYSDQQIVTNTSSFCPLVWGTWKDRWPEISANWDFNYSSGNPDGSEAGWDWNMTRLAEKTKRHFVFPMLSRSDHIGEHKGTHMIPADFPGSQAPTFKPDHGWPIKYTAWSNY
jgi:hypothetical protein